MQGHIGRVGVSGKDLIYTSFEKADRKGLPFRSACFCESSL
jgi:hypothetical protein